MRLWRFCLAGFVYDWLVFVAWTIIPIRATTLQASSTQLGLLQGASTLAYVAGCILVGQSGHGRIKRLFIVLGCLGAAASCMWIASVQTLTPIFLGVALLGLANSLFWPSVQGSIGVETDPARLERAIGLFNVMWSAGKGLGYLMAGGLTAALSDGQILWLAAVTALPILAFYPWASAPAAKPAHEAAHDDRTAFRLMSYVANFAGYGALNTFQSHFYKYLTQSDQGQLLGAKSYFGVFLGIMIAAQTLTFLALQRGAGWAYRRGLLFATQAILGAAAAGLAVVRNDLAILALAPLIGLGAGFVNASSIYYSLHGPADHGKNAGIHESILSLGAFLVPLAGGLLADAAGDLRMPYAFASACILAGIAVQEAIYRRSSRS